MKRRNFLSGLTTTSALLLAGAQANAATYAEDVVGQLTSQGFYNIAVQTTWLGRVRILADRNDGRREIILNPRTGEVLRDSWQAIGAGSATPIIDDIDHADSENAASGGTDHSGSGSNGSGGDDGGDAGGDDGGGGDDTGGGGHDSTDHGGSDHGSSDHGGSDESGHGGGNKSDDKVGKDD